MNLLRPLPQGLRRPLTVLALAAWAAQMGWLFRVTFKAAPVALAADLARYGSASQWKGVYYHGEKIGFTVSQTTSTDDGYELREDGRLQMSLLGASTAVRLSTVANVDREFALQRFSFALDPGTGPTEISGSVSGKTLALRIKTPSGERHETRQLEAPPALQMNLSRKLAAQGLQEGQRLVVEVFDPATMKNAPLALEIERREVVRVGARPTPVFKMLSRFSGVTSTSWITETGEVVREESPFGLLVVKESPQQAQALAVGHAQIDMLEAAALHPRLPRRIDDPRAVRRLSIRLTGLEAFEDADLEGAGQSRRGDAIEVVDARTLEPTALDPERASFLAAETLLESDAPEIRAEAEKALLGLTGARARAERLVRHVNALLEKKPTISLPSALEVLRTRVGDCNEHTALFVALARASGIPARIAVGLVQLHGAFYYHAWAEVYLEEQGRGLWLPVDPTLNEFPADATHIRLSRGGLEKQAAILGFVGRAQMTVREVDLDATATPILVGAATDREPLQLPLLPREGPGRSCWAAPQGSAPE